MQSASPRSSTSSDSFSSGRQSPIHGFESSAALILVPDGEDAANNAPFDFSGDSDSEDDADGQSERVQASAVPPMSSTSVFLYLLSPFLKLGALLLPDAGLPLKSAIPCILFFAGLSAFTRQIWYMLARYVRRADMEEIMLETFARERGREGRRSFLRQAVRLSSGVFRILLSALYIRASVEVLLPLLPEKLLLPSQIIAPILLAIVVSPFYFAPTLATNRVIYATWASVAAYIGWFSCRIYSHTHGITHANMTYKTLGVLWQGIPAVAFAFTTSSTIPLYASLRGTVQPLSTRPRSSHSFKFVSVLSVGMAILCILPLAFVADTPTVSFGTREDGDPHSSKSPEAASQALASLTAVLDAAVLVLSVPSILIPSPALPIPSYFRRATSLPLSKLLVYVISVSLSLLPWPLCNALSDITWLLAFLSTYMLPAFIHIVLHNFRRPLSIIIPPTTPVLPSPSSVLSAAEASDSRHDELLQRKERTLQRRRLGRRIVWDIGVWVLLLPVGGGGLVWAGGRLLGRW